MAELLLLRADALELIAVAQLAQYAGQRALAGGEDDLHARRGLILRGLYIPRVRDQPRGVARDDRGAVRGQKARGVVDVPVVHEQDGVQPGAGDGFFDSLGVCHFKYASNVCISFRKDYIALVHGPGEPLAEGIYRNAVHALEGAEGEHGAAVGQRAVEAGELRPLGRDL